MKFLKIGKGLYINVERIDGITVTSRGEVKVYVGGSDESWTVDKTYVNEFLERIHGEGSNG